MGGVRKIFIFASAEHTNCKFHVSNMIKSNDFKIAAIGKNNSKYCCNDENCGIKLISLCSCGANVSPGSPAGHNRGKHHLFTINEIGK